MKIHKIQTLCVVNVVETQLLASLLMLAAVSCSKEKEILPDTAAAVRFSVAIAGNNATTRAAGTQWTAGDKIGIHMTDGMVVTAYQNMPYTADANGNFTATAGDMYYPANGSMVGFTAYYPYNTALQNGSFAVDLTDQSNPETIDLLYASTMAQHSKLSTGSVTLPFRHVMSKLVLKTVAGAGFTATDLAGMSVSITGLNSAATFNTVSGELTDRAMHAPIVPYIEMDGSHYEAIVLPAAIAAQSMKVTFTVNGNHYVWYAPALSLAPATLHEWTITISHTGITATATNIAPWDTTSPIVNDDTRPVYKIGDYYPDPANSATAIGVVFSISNGSKNGKIVSLDEGQNLQWSTESCVTGAISDFDGEANTNAIKEYKQNNPTSTVTFPAFAWCINKGARWYLPSKNELVELYGKKQAVNNALAGIAGATQLYSGWYRSSTEYAPYSNLAWLIYFSNGNIDYDYKLAFINVRAVSKF